VLVGPNPELLEVVRAIEMWAINGCNEERWRLTIDEMAGYGSRPVTAGSLSGICRRNSIGSIAQDR